MAILLILLRKWFVTKGIFQISRFTSGPKDIDKSNFVYEFHAMLNQVNSNFQQLFTILLVYRIDQSFLPPLHSVQTFQMLGISNLPICFKFRPILVKF